MYTYGTPQDIAVYFLFRFQQFQKDWAPPEGSFWKPAPAPPFCRTVLPRRPAVFHPPLPRVPSRPEAVTGERLASPKELAEGGACRAGEGCKAQWNRIGAIADTSGGPATRTTRRSCWSKEAPRRKAMNGGCIVAHWARQSTITKSQGSAAARYETIGRVAFRCKLHELPICKLS